MFQSSLQSAPFANYEINVFGANERGADQEQSKAKQTIALAVTEDDA